MYQGFNHLWNVQMCIQNCINAGSEERYIQAVKMLELTLQNDLQETDLQKIKAIQEREAKLGQMGNEFRMAGEVFGVLYSMIKHKSPKRVVLAIGRPKCPKCGELIRFATIKRLEKEAKEKEALNATEPTTE